jgi:hypothetical protein
VAHTWQRDRWHTRRGPHLGAGRRGRGRRRLRVKRLHRCCCARCGRLARMRQREQLELRETRVRDERALEARKVGVDERVQQRQIIRLLMAHSCNAQHATPACIKQRAARNTQNAPRNMHRAASRTAAFRLDTAAALGGCVAASTRQYSLASTSEGLAALMRDVSAGRTVGSASIAPCSRAVHSRTTSAHRCSECQQVSSYSARRCCGALWRCGAAID